MSVPGLSLAAGRDRMAEGPPGFAAASPCAAPGPCGRTGRVGRGQDRGTEGQGSVWLHSAVLVPPRGELDPSGTAGQLLRWHSWTDAAVAQLESHCMGQSAPKWHSWTTSLRARQLLLGLNRLGGTAGRWPCRHAAPQASSPRARLLPSPHCSGAGHRPHEGVPGHGAPRPAFLPAPCL